jgi:7-carboxy-7-deazaguanine synthase
LERIQKYPCHLIEITGGEPLLQAGTPELIQRLLDKGYEVLIETGGHREIEAIDRRAKMIMDIKTPSSGEENKNHWENIQKLMPHDQIKFVIGDKEDYEWAKNVINNYSLTNRVSYVLMSCVFAKLPPQPLAEWILRDGLPVRFQLQMHKYIWDPNSRGV